ncbi:MAG TPA: M20/M25/M40 family metallo-hydrolase [Vicinamibacterales bacterium]|nr:M20/M25/M40 family metallo-hydrolase [Vicinamibacterales bacterium]
MTARPFALAVAVLCAAAGALAQSSSPAWLEPYRPIAQRIIQQSESSDFAWRRLAELTDTFGNRLSGSETLEQAIDWAVAAMKADGLENVRKEPAMVPKWVRGRESLDLVLPVKQPLVMLGLGDSVGTPAGGIEADVVIVKSFDDLDRRGAEVKGKIVLFNAPFTDYGQTRPYRSDGPSRAAKLGALATLVRSVGPAGLRTPHTGGLTYTGDAPKIPAAAIPTEDADRFQRLADRGVRVRVKLSMEAHFDPDAQSYNVVGELRGRELPNEILVMGGHFDSWDVGAGASDDGGGCIVTWEALRLMKQLNLRPRRTVRVVLFVNEENGTRGGNAYRDTHQAELGNHVVLLESDGGVFDPAGFGFSGPEAAKPTLAAIASLLGSIGSADVTSGGGGTDIEPAATAGKIPMIEHRTNGEYFLIHHTQADTIARITPKQMSDNSAAIAVLMYTIADLPWRLGAEK